MLAVSSGCIYQELHATVVPNSATPACSFPAKCSAGEKTFPPIASQPLFAVSMAILAARTAAACIQKKALYSTSVRKLPGLDINAKLVICGREPSQQPAKTAQELDREISIQNCAKFVPDAIVRRIPRLRREKQLEDAVHESRKVKLVDGSYAQLSSARERLRPRPQIKLQEKRTAQISIRQMRVGERLYSELLSILTLAIKDAHIKLPVWRLTRVQPSPDYRTCVALWTIDDPTDYQKYYEPLASAFSNAAATVRYELARRLSLGHTPTVRFKYEDYSALALAETLSQEEQEEDQDQDQRRLGNTIQSLLQKIND